MRMWMVDPKFLCRKHLLGEHGEIHKHRHNFVKKHNISGRIKPVVQIEPSAMESRHDDLAKEMLSRNYKHKSSYVLPDLSYLSAELRCARVDKKQAIKDLCSRCMECRERVEASYEET